MFLFVISPRPHPRFVRSDARRVNPILLDRLKRISLDAPSLEMRVEIAEKHILPRMREATRCMLPLSSGTLRTIVDMHKDDQGMRGIERSIHELLSVALMCEQYGSKRIAGIDCDTPILSIDDDFVSHTLDHRKRVSTATRPPSTMFL